jgi:hypothetical protein
MKPDENYAREKFNEAIHVLATSAANLRWRLYAAFMAFHPVRDEYFTQTEDLEDYQFIVRELTSPGPMSETSLEGVPDDKCEEIAERILKLRESLERRRPR